MIRVIEDDQAARRSHAQPSTAPRSAPVKEMTMGKLKRLAQPIGVLFPQMSIEVFIETGTFHGESLDFALTLPVRQWHSVELSAELHATARVRYAGIRGLTLHQGDSASVLPEILGDLRQPALFWLDAHYCFLDSARGPKDCPLLEEIGAIAEHERRAGVQHAVLIDDYHILGTSPGSDWLVGDEVAFVPEADWSEVTAERVMAVLGERRKQFHVWGDALFALPTGVDVSSVVPPSDPFRDTRVTRAGQVPLPGCTAPGPDCQ